MEMSIKERFMEVDKNISDICVRINRTRDEIKVIVVTKKQPVESILEVINAGAVHLGENYPEETIEKISGHVQLLKMDWHMIGHVQSRKVKLLNPIFKTIHSVDSVEIARNINNYLAISGQSINALLEVNITGELTKYGFDASSLEKRDSLVNTFEELNKLNRIHFIGLMTMPPYETQEGQNKECYNLCRNFMEHLQVKVFGKAFSELSMGTSADYATAIAEGATFVRIGEAIMGKRKYKEIGK